MEQHSRNPTLQAPGNSATQFKVAFSQSKKSASIDSNTTVLDAADSCGVEILNDCRAGNCGSCAAKLLKGRVAMDGAHALTDEDRANGFILTCQAKPQSDIEIES